MWSALSYNIHHHAGLFFIERLEAPLIALALFLVQVNLLGKMGLDRFLLSWLGVVILAWTMRSILKVDEARVVYGKISGVLEHPAFLSVQSRSASLLIGFIVDLTIIVTIMFVVRGYSDLTDMAAFAALVVLTQAAVNFSIFLFHLFMLRWFNVKNIMVVVFVFFVIMSPVIFMFNDLDKFGNQYFTSVNPAAHFLAAYYNIFWFREPMSLQVLPIFLVLAVLFIFVHTFIIEPRVIGNNAKGRGGSARQKALSLGRFTERDNITGLELFFIFYAFGSHSMKELPDRVNELLTMQEFQDQFRRGLSTYSRLNDRYLDLLLASCLAGAGETRVSLPDEEILHVAEAQFESVVGRVNAIMGTKLFMIGGHFQEPDD